MGLKSKLNKMKSFLFDEDDDEKEYKKPKKNILKPDKTVAKLDEEKFSQTQEIEELSFDDVGNDVFEEAHDIKSRVQRNDNDFKFPEFDDDDFMVRKPVPDERKPIVKEEPKRILYQGSKRKEETKKFKPSPIISPIYGLLDKDGNTVQKESKTSEYKSSVDEVSFDDVRKKAYGSFDEELENTIKRLSKKTIEEAEKDMEEEEKFIGQEKANVLIDEAVVISKQSDDDNDDMILPNINFKEIDVDKEYLKKEEKQKDKVSLTSNVQTNDEDDYEDTKEQDLFNLIDSMYQKGDEE